MYDGGKILIGLIIFLALITFPLWYNPLFGDMAYATPELQKPKKSKVCIEDAEWMLAEHMQLLDDWRDLVVREKNRIYVNHAGKDYEMSLQKTCMDCHTSKKEFCDKCHNNLAVSPYCWDCHIPPKEEM